MKNENESNILARGERIDQCTTTPRITISQCILSLTRMYASRLNRNWMKNKNTQRKKTYEIKPQRGVMVERGEIICSMQGKIKKSNYVHPLSSG